MYRYITASEAEPTQGSRNKGRQAAGFDTRESGATASTSPLVCTPPALSTSGGAYRSGGACCCRTVSSRTYRPGRSRRGGPPPSDSVQEQYSRAEHRCDKTRALVEMPKSVGNLLGNAEPHVVGQDVVTLAAVHALGQVARAKEKRLEGEGELITADPGKAAYVGVRLSRRVRQFPEDFLLALPRCFVCEHPTYA